jgi:hypothetical protein
MMSGQAAFSEPNLIQPTALFAIRGGDTIDSGAATNLGIRIWDAEDRRAS